MTTNKSAWGRVGGALAGAALVAALGTLTATAQAAATIVIMNTNAPGVGFNDPTPAAPVGGNAGTTLGQQRLIAFQAAADIWGATLTSSQTIKIRASFEPLTCTATSAVLGSAGAYNIWSDFPNAAKAGAWYPQALANKLAGTDLSEGDPQGQDIQARFNSRLGLFSNCLPGSPFYLGLDNNHGTAIDLVTVLLHEFGHGLGFQTFTSGATGDVFFGQPSIWDYYLMDDTTGKLWINMTSAERAASALKPRQLSWTGANVTNAVPTALSAGTPRLQVYGAAGGAAGTYDVGGASFGPPLSTTPVTGQMVQLVDQPNGTGLACTPVAGNAFQGKVAVVDRGVCGFAVKAAIMQAAGAKGVVIVDNVAGGPPAGMSGTDPTITIPSVRITLEAGTLIKKALAERSGGVIGRFDVNTAQYAGADAFGRALMYTPNPYQSGSSVSHWDTIAFPNQLMEPAINADLLHTVVMPADMTFELLKDIGW
jgi:hypothetical protein